MGDYFYCGINMKCTRSVHFTLLRLFQCEYPTVRRLLEKIRLFILNIVQNKWKKARSGKSCIVVIKYFPIKCSYTLNIKIILKHGKTET